MVITRSTTARDRDSKQEQRPEKKQMAKSAPLQGEASVNEVILFHISSGACSRCCCSSRFARGNRMNMSPVTARGGYNERGGHFALFL